MKKERHWRTRRDWFKPVWAGIGYGEGDSPLLANIYLRYVSFLQVRRPLPDDQPINRKFADAQLFNPSLPDYKSSNCERADCHRAHGGSSNRKAYNCKPNQPKSPVIYEEVVCLRL
jgi:hypothetical protein